MGEQRAVAGEVGRASVGRELKVLVEEPGVARGEADAPDIDGRVYVPRSLPVGEFARVRVTAARDYDLIALPAGERPAAFKVAKMAQ
jgi:ribosomal protein S12 methylthiotransferase